MAEENGKDILMKKNKFTLLELLVVIGIIAIAVFAIYLLFGHPPVNYEDYNKERNKRIEKLTPKNFFQGDWQW